MPPEWLRVATSKVVGRGMVRLHGCKHPTRALLLVIPARAGSGRLRFNLWSSTMTLRERRKRGSRLISSTPVARARLRHRWSLRVDELSAIFDGLLAVNHAATSASCAETHAARWYEGPQCAAGRTHTTHSA